MFREMLGPSDRWAFTSVPYFPRLRAAIALMVALHTMGLAAVAQQGADVESGTGPGRRRLSVVVSLMPPMVEEGEDSFRGFDIDIWQEISRRLDYDVTYRRVEFDAILPTVARRDADVGLAGITITSEREEAVDFSHPYIASGLTTLVPATREADPRAAIRSLLAPQRLWWLVVLALFVIVSGLVLWFADVMAPEAVIDRKPWPGIPQALWCVVTTVTTVGYGDIVPKGVWSRSVTLLVMLGGIALFGIAISQLSAELAVQGLASDIGGPQDLHGKRVATRRGTTSEDILHSLGASVVLADEVEGLYLALDAGRADAVVFDAPTLRHFVRNEGAGRYEVVGGVFDAQDYGIAMTPGSELREDVNRALLKLKEDGTYQLIYARYFGSVE